MIDVCEHCEGRGVVCEEDGHEVECPVCKGGGWSMTLSSQNHENPSFENQPENADPPDESAEPEPYWTGPGYRGEYQCPHGVGHGNHIHGCDGCCQLPDFPLNATNIERTRQREEKARAIALDTLDSDPAIPVATDDGCLVELDVGVLGGPSEVEEGTPQEAGSHDGPVPDSKVGG